MVTRDAKILQYRQGPISKKLHSCPVVFLLTKDGSIKVFSKMKKSKKVIYWSSCQLYVLYQCQIEINQRLEIDRIHLLLDGDLFSNNTCARVWIQIIPVCSAVIPFWTFIEKHVGIYHGRSLPVWLALRQATFSQSLIIDDSKDQYVKSNWQIPDLEPT